MSNVILSRLTIDLNRDTMNETKNLKKDKN